MMRRLLALLVIASGSLGAQTSINGPTVIQSGTGSGTVLPSPQFSLFYQPTTGTVSQAAGDPNITTDGAGNVTGISLKAQAIGGFRYAVQWQTGGGNNGIANAAAANQAVVADPSYSTTEQYSPASPIPSWPSNFIFKDQRPGKNLYLYHNPAITPTYGDVNNPPESHFFVRDGTAVPTVEGGVQQNSLIVFDMSISDNNSQPGYSWGTRWEVPLAVSIAQQFNGSGISEALNTDTFKYGKGDTVGVYCQANGYGGADATNDEGTKACSGSTTEPPIIRTAPCTTGCTAGSTQLKLTIPNCPPTTAGGNGCIFGTGHPFIDTTAGATATTVSAIGVGLNTSMSAVTVAATVPVSTAWGTLANTITPTTTTVVVPPFTQPMTFNVNVTSGTFTAPGLVCFSQNQQEQAAITAVGTPSGGVQSVTVAVHNGSGHASGSYLLEGGMCGNGYEQTAYTIGGLRYLLDIVGSTDAHTLQVIAWYVGVAHQITNWGQINLSNAITGTISLGTLTNSGTTVSATYNGGTLSVPSNFGGSTFVITGASDSVFNANCTAAVWTTPTNLTCTIAGLSGSHTSVSATASLGLNGVNIWPWATVWDVQNETLTPPSMDGSFTLSPNNVAFATSDTIQQPHHHAGQFNGARFQDVVQNPGNIGTPFTTSIQGPGAQGGGLATGQGGVVSLGVVQADSYYFGSGGFHFAPNFVNHFGPYYIGNNYDHGPQISSPGLNVVRTAAFQNTDVNYCFNFYNFFNAVGNNTLNNCPSTQNMQLTIGGTGTYTIKAPTADFSQIGTLYMPSFTLSTAAGLVSGQGYNYAPFSNQLTGANWHVTGGALTGGTPTCSITDDQGNAACTLTTTTFANFTDNLSGAFTAMTANAQFSTQMRLQGLVGGETVSVGAAFLGTNFTLTSNWANYCATYTTPASGAGLTNFASINLTASETVNISNVVTRPGPCGPPLQTANNQSTTLTNVSHAVTFDSNAYTLAGVAESTVGGLPVVIAAGTATGTTAAITAPACGATVTVAATGVLATDAITWSFNAAPAGTNAGLVSWPTAGNVNFAYCPGVTETPSAATINWRVVR